jgi:hypothetical protein
MVRGSKVDDLAWRNPITGTGCCARAVNDHANGGPKLTHFAAAKSAARPRELRSAARRRRLLHSRVRRFVCRLHSYYGGVRASASAQSA